MISLSAAKTSVVSRFFQCHSGDLVKNWIYVYDSDIFSFSVVHVSWDGKEKCEKRNCSCLNTKRIQKR